MGLKERVSAWLRDRRARNTAKRAAFIDGLETEAEYKERWTSIRVVYFTMFLISLGFSIILTGVWPYLDKLDPHAGKNFMGYVVAANPFAQMVFSPLVGWWSNRLGSIRVPLLASLVIFTISSGIYSSLELFQHHRKYWMLGARFLVGVSSANIAACRSYLSAATRLSERTRAVSMVSLAQVLGFVVGPGLQTAVVPLGDNGVWLIPGRLKLNMFTAAGWINVLLGAFNACLFLPSVFKERKIAAKEVMVKQGVDTEKAAWKLYKPDYLSAWTLIIAFFTLVFNFMLLETLSTSLTMDQFAWTKAEALSYMGIIMSVGAVLACVTFAAISPLCKMFAEHKVLIWGGFFMMAAGCAMVIPWPGDPPRMYDDSFLAAGNASAAELDSRIGCPTSQTWCKNTPALRQDQFLIGYALTVVGYPIGVTLIQTIFSKVLGPRPQGTWMGLMTGAGCLSRVLGPVFVSFVYTSYGTTWTFGLTTVMMLICMFWLLLFADRLMPVEKRSEETVSLHQQPNQPQQPDEQKPQQDAAGAEEVVLELV